MCTPNLAPRTRAPRHRSRRLRRGRGLRATMHWCPHAGEPRGARSASSSHLSFIKEEAEPRAGGDAGRTRRAALQCAAPVIDRHARRRAAGQSAGRRARRP